MDQDSSQDAIAPLPEGTAPQRSARRIIAVGGGKGGAGKSLLAANIAILYLFAGLA